MNPCKDCQHYCRCMERSRAMLCRDYIGQNGRRLFNDKTKNRRGGSIQGAQNITA